MTKNNIKTYLYNLINGDLGIITTCLIYGVLIDAFLFVIYFSLSSATILLTMLIPHALFKFIVIIGSYKSIKKSTTTSIIKSIGIILVIAQVIFLAYIMLGTFGLLI